MKTLLTAVMLCISLSIACSQSCPTSTVFQGIEMPVVQIRNQCFFYDNTGSLVQQGIESMINLPFDLGDGGQIANLRFTIRNAAISNYQHSLTFDGCNPVEEIRFVGRIWFDADASVVFIPISIEGTASAQIVVRRTYSSSVSETGTNLQLLNTAVTRNNVDINSNNIGFDLLAPMLEPFIVDQILGTGFTQGLQSIMKLDDTIVPFSPEISGPSTICENSVTLTAPAGFESYIWSTGAKENSIVVSEPGTYSVEIEHGCNIATVSKEVVKKNPIRDFIVTDFLCADKIKLSVPGFETVQWSNGSSGDTLEVSESGVYEVAVVDADGCQGTDKVTVNVHGSCMQPLDVSAICSDKPNSFRRWLISNPNDMVVRVDWEIPGSSERAWMDVPAGESTLTTNTAKFNTNSITIYWHDLSGQLQSVDAAGTTLKCEKMQSDNARVGSPVSLYPNPAVDHFLLSIDSEVEQEMPFQIRSQTGLVREQGSFRVGSGKNYIHYDVSKLVTGEYIMMLGRETIRFVKK